MGRAVGWGCDETTPLRRRFVILSVSRQQPEVERKCQCFRLVRVQNIKRAFDGEEVNDVRSVSLLDTKTIKYYSLNYIK